MGDSVTILKNSKNYLSTSAAASKQRLKSKSRQEKNRKLKNLKNQVYRLKAGIKVAKKNKLTYLRAIDSLMENMSDAALLICTNYVPFFLLLNISKSPLF